MEIIIASMGGGWYISLHENHANQPFIVGKYTILRYKWMGLRMEIIGI